jgi:predicted kinase
MMDRAEEIDNLFGPGWYIERSMPTVHMVCGPPVAGKTTYGHALALRKRAMFFSMHDWMKVLFDADRGPSPPPGWLRDRSIRCETQMWTLADTLLERGVDVVFDVGLATIDQRDRFRSRVAHTRAASKMHYLDVGREVRLARALAGGMTEATFLMLEGRFETPSDDELHGAMIVCAG